LHQNCADIHQVNCEFVLTYIQFSESAELMRDVIIRTTAGVDNNIPHPKTVSIFTSQYYVVNLILSYILVCQSVLKNVVLRSKIHNAINSKNDSKCAR